MRIADGGRRFGCVAVAIACGTVLLAACAPLDGQAPSGPRFPTRPVPISLDRLDPCAMLSADQKAVLGLPRGTATRPTVNGVPGVGCVWSSDVDTDYTAQTIRLGAEQAVTEPGSVVIEVAGFGAVRNAIRDPLLGGAPGCQVTVDAAPGGSIRVQAIGGVDPRPTDEEMCRLATEAAAMVMTTVVASAR